MSITFIGDRVRIYIPYVIWGMIPCDTRQCVIRNALERPEMFPSYFGFVISNAAYCTLSEGMAHALQIDPAAVAKFWAFAVNHDYDVAEKERDAYKGSNNGRSVA